MLTQIRNKLDSFIKYLTARGAEVLVSTNEWEVLRFRTGSGVSIIYRTASGNVTFTGEAEQAWRAFKQHNPGPDTWNPKLPTDSGKKEQRPRGPSVIRRTLRDRDGDLCFYCLLPMTEEQATIEHLVALAHGGPNHLSNLVLACTPCNKKAGHLPAIEKIRLRVEAALRLHDKWVAYQSRHQLEQNHAQRPVLENTPDA